MASTDKISPVRLTDDHPTIVQQDAGSDDAAISLDDIIITEQLAHRPSRPADHEAENKALVGLASELAESPRTILQNLVESALKLCNADSAGISIFEQADGKEIFRWHATAGAFASYRGGTMPRSFSPCGTVLDRNAPLLMAEPARYYPDIRAIHPRVYEVLLIPFYQGATPMGTVWVVSHSPEKLFQAEDARLVTSLCKLAAAGVGVLSNLSAVESANEMLRNEAMERARAETARRETEEHHRFATEAGRTGSWYVRLDTMECILSPMMKELMGFAPGTTNISAEQWRQRVVPEDHAGLEAAIMASIAHDAPFNFEFRIALEDGSQRWLFSHGGVARDAAGKAVRLHGASVDISARQRADERDRQAGAEAIARAEANAKFRTFFDQGTYFAGVMTLDGTVIEANRLCLEACGFTRDQIIGKKFWHCGWWNRSPALVEMIREGSMQAAAGRLFRRETTYFIADGSERVVDLTLAPVTDDAGRVLFVAPSGIDITDKKRMADERERLLDAERAARAEAEEANRAKDKFLAVLSHELRTPLSPVVMTIPEMEIDPDMPFKFREDLTMVRQNIDLEVKLIDDLLDLSRITTGKLRLQMQPVRVHELLRHALHNSLSDTSGKRLNVHHEFNAGNDRMTADPARLQQVFWNLIRNAVKFSAEGGTITVRTWNPQGDGQLNVEVRDNGIGIEADLLPRIFDAFEQGDARMTHQFGGLGLGLAIAKAVVEMHGGTIAAASDGPKKGATFTVMLDAVSANSAERQRTDTPRCLAAAPPQAPRRVLLVEDHPDTARTMARLLTRSGFAVMTAGSVASALKIAAAESFDVVVSDIGLPDASGYELMRQIRDRYGIKGIALSGYGMEEDMRKSREAGFVDHVVKPVNVAELEAIIRRVTSAG
ncbi:MAG: ATP-binding protein [Planctomycetota bacterium]|nr:ATP-binding protein [Planctomycetota bacterium]